LKQLKSLISKTEEHTKKQQEQRQRKQQRQRTEKEQDNLLMSQTITYDFKSPKISTFELADGRSFYAAFTLNKKQFGKRI
jgi:hypothetical protein